MTKRMDHSVVDRALKALGERVQHYAPVELLLVGGAAGMLTGVLDRGRTTLDCDVMICEPDEALATIELEAQRVAKDLGLPPNWFNSNVRLRRDALPDGWEKRRVWVCNHGPLRFFVASRPDLIAMKVLAGRPQDLEDLEAMRLIQEDIDFVRIYLSGLKSKGTTETEIDEAKELLDELKVHEP